MSLQRVVTNGLAILLSLCLMPAVGAPAPNASSGIGINLSPPSPGLVFKDIMKQSHEWIGSGFSTDENGWITSMNQEVKTTMVMGDTYYPGGTYVMLYDGEGEFYFGRDAVITKHEPGRVELAVLGELEAIAQGQRSGIMLHITSVKPGNHLRNIRIILPGHEQDYLSQPFYEPYLDLLRNYRVLRFMDWGATNNSVVTSWSTRRTPHHQTQMPSDSERGGVAVEYMCLLANTLQADPWFCMPHLADDTYIRSFAQLVKEQLDPARNVYVEFSNELWNVPFDQYRWAVDEGKRRYPAEKQGTSRARVVAEEHIRTHTIWQSVFTGADTQRLICVIGDTFHGGGTPIALDWKDAHTYADAVAGAPYFGSHFCRNTSEEQLLSMTIDELLDSVAAEMRTRNVTNFEQIFANAQSRELALVAYEAGQHLVKRGAGEAVDQMLMNANRHPRMKDLYLEYMTHWAENGGDIMCMFSDMGTYTEWGSWGLLESMYQDTQTAYKWLAVQEFIAANPYPWGSAATVPAGWRSPARLSAPSMGRILNVGRAHRPWRWAGPCYQPNGRRAGGMIRSQGLMVRAQSDRYR